MNCQLLKNSMKLRERLALNTFISKEWHSKVRLYATDVKESKQDNALLEKHLPHKF